MLPGVTPAQSYCARCWSSAVTAEPLPTGGYRVACRDCLRSWDVTEGERAPAEPERCPHGRRVAEFCGSCRLACRACDGSGGFVSLDERTGEPRESTRVPCLRCMGSGVEPCALCPRPATCVDGEPVCAACAAAIDVRDTIPAPAPGMVGAA